jgi:hypothetical protein
MESAGRPLKEMYHSTNRHATDFTLQLGKRFFETFFLTRVWPHYTGKYKAPGLTGDPLLNVNCTVGVGVGMGVGAGVREGEGGRGLYGRGGGGKGGGGERGRGYENNANTRT